MNREGYRNDTQRFADLDAEYEILRELGRGGTAVVYLARDRELDREVAIKVIRSTWVEDEGAAARLMREARTASLLHHPNIVMLYGTRRLGDGSLALIMQYVRGRTLKATVRERGALPVGDVQRILCDIARALECAQRRRIVHRDIKPENIYLDEDTGAARLSDFGIARPWDADCSLTLPGMAIGTPAYMSPEQIDGTAVDGRSDIYSLGLVGYELLTGRAPWAGESLYATIYKQKHEGLPSLAELRPDVPAPLRQAIERALRKEPSARWPDATAFLAALEEPAAGRAGAGKQRGRRQQKAGRPSRRGRKSAAAAVPQVGMSEPEKVGPEESVTLVYRREDVGAAAAAGSAGPEVTGRRGSGDRTRPAGVVGRAADADADAGVGRGTGGGVASATSAGVGALAAAGGGQALPEPGGARGRRLDDRDSAPTTHAEDERLERRRPSPSLVAAVLAAVLVGTPVYVAVGSRPQPERVTAQPGMMAEAQPEPQVLVPNGAGGGADAGVPALALPLYGDVQQGTAGDTLPAPLVVRVEDDTGRPVQGAAVSFVVRQGDGAVLPERVLTDAYGLATARWVPASAGDHRVEAVLAGLRDAPVFRASVLPRAGVRLVGAEPASAASGRRLEVRAEDEAGRPASGVEVRFVVTSGGGRIEPARAVTGRDGRARAQWVFGGRGAQEAEARLGTPAGGANGANGPNGANGAGEVVVFRAEPEAVRLAVRSGFALGGTHTCALGADGSMTCWGGNESGQLGDGSAGRRGGAVLVVAGEPFASVSAGVSHTCAVSVSGAVNCWGANAAGQLGDGSRVGRARPVAVRSDVVFADVFAGMSHTCGIEREGRMHCWGDNAHGQLGDGSRAARDAPVAVRGGRRYRTAAAGWAHSCAIATDGAAWCWGRNMAGELGDGSTTDRTQPVAVRGGHRFNGIATGSTHTCGLRRDGAILCWGQNSHGQLGSGAAGASAIPTVVSAPEPFTAVTVGGVHSCGLGRSGTAYCWGRNTYGQLGDGSTENRWEPVPVAGGLRFTSLQASGAHTCGIADGAQYCWGYNIEGQLGTGSRTNQSRPGRVTSRR